MIIKYTNKEIDYLCEKDLMLAAVMRKYGIIEAGTNCSLFEAIVFNIIGQMLSNKVADIICNRFKTAVGSVEPNTILSVADETIRNCGISYRKISCIKELCGKILNKEIDLDTVRNMSDNDLINYLTSIKGVGKWTAEMIAMFSLGRLNIFSYSDVALKNGIVKVHKEYENLTRDMFEKLRDLYSPYCSIAALYYYHVNDFE